MYFIDDVCIRLLYEWSIKVSSYINILFVGSKIYRIECL